VAPIGSPPLGWQVPGVYVNGPALLLPRADPAGTLPQFGCVESSGNVKGSGALHALSLKMEIDPAHALPLGAEQVQGEHVRSSLT
jgi:hypothetical protein